MSEYVKPIKFCIAGVLLSMTPQLFAHNVVISGELLEVQDSILAALDPTHATKEDKLASCDDLVIREIVVNDQGLPANLDDSLTQGESKLCSSDIDLRNVDTKTLDLNASDLDALGTPNKLASECSGTEAPSYQQCYSQYRRSSHDDILKIDPRCAKYFHSFPPSRDTAIRAQDCSASDPAVEADGATEVRIDCVEFLPNDKRGEFCFDRNQYLDKVQHNIIFGGFDVKSLTPASKKPKEKTILEIVDEEMQAASQRCAAKAVEEIAHLNLSIDPERSHDTGSKGYEKPHREYVLDPDDTYKKEPHLHAWSTYARNKARDVAERMMMERINLEKGASSESETSKVGGGIKASLGGAELNSSAEGSRTISRIGGMHLSDKGKIEKAGDEAYQRPNDFGVRPDTDCYKGDRCRDASGGKAMESPIENEDDPSGAPVFGNEKFDPNDKDQENRITGRDGIDYDKVWDYPPEKDIWPGLAIQKTKKKKIKEIKGAIKNPKDPKHFDPGNFEQAKQGAKYAAAKCYTEEVQKISRKTVDPHYQEHKKIEVEKVKNVTYDPEMVANPEPDNSCTDPEKAKLRPHCKAFRDATTTKSVCDQFPMTPGCPGAPSTVEDPDVDCISNPFDAKCPHVHNDLLKGAGELEKLGNPKPSIGTGVFP